jgi:hypothetical protein
VAIVYDFFLKISFKKKLSLQQKKSKEEKMAGGGWYCGGENYFINLCSENIL